jgi:hypothetical protein
MLIIIYKQNKSKIGGKKSFSFVCLIVCIDFEFLILMHYKALIYVLDMYMILYRDVSINNGVLFVSFIVGIHNLVEIFLFFDTGVLFCKYVFQPCIFLQYKYSLTSTEGPSVEH